MPWKSQGLDILQWGSSHPYVCNRIYVYCLGKLTLRSYVNQLNRSRHWITRNLLSLGLSEEILQILLEVPGGYRRFPEVTRKFPEVTRRFPEVPGGYRRLPGGSRRLPEVPGGCQEVPGGYRRFPVGSRRLLGQTHEVVRVILPISPVSVGNLPENTRVVEDST